MDCHRCEHLRYDGHPYGRCTCVGHGNVVFDSAALRKRVEEGVRPYDKRICPDFKMRKRCSNCKYWMRGRYFADGKTPARKGKCTLDCKPRTSICELWRAGPTSGRRKSI